MSSKENKSLWSCWDEWRRVTKELNDKWDLSTIYITCREGAWTNDIPKRRNENKKHEFNEDDAEAFES